MYSRSNRIFGTPAKTFELGGLGLIALLALTAATGYFVLYPPRKDSFAPPPVISRDESPRPVRNRDFKALFESDIPLARLSRPRQYTVVEVYVDECMYCRQFEEAFDVFNQRRTDVSLFRVHHPGDIEMRVLRQSDPNMQQQLAALNARMDRYGVCATPHIEVYGPDRKLLAQDTCGARNGTAFAWEWITHETGVESSLPVNGFSSLTQSEGSVNFVKIFLGIEVAYLLLLSIQGALNYNKNGWDLSLKG